ncbi:MAG: DUF6160 family protein [Desulfomonilia bacterium]|jgi:hypothetical protein
MKRVLTILAILLLPLSVWAMTPVTDSDLSNVTGQAGVSINQDVMMNIHMDVMAWGDTDGLGLAGIGTTSALKTGLNPWTDVTTGGYIGIKGFDMALRIKARTTDTYGAATGSDTNAVYGVYNPTSYPGLKPLTIDVATTTAAQDPNLYGAGVTFVRIGLGSMEIDVSAMSFDIGLSSHAGVTATNAPTLNQILGTVSMGNIGIFISPYSYVDIYNGARGTGSGVTFGIHFQIDQFNMDYISWGDKDGFTNVDTSDNAGMLPGYTNTNPFPWAAATKGGYIGLGTLRVGGPITITGTVNIDVGTVTTGYYASAAAILTGGTITNVPMVHITFGNMSAAAGGPAAGPAYANGVGLEVNVPSIMANIALSDTANLLNNFTGSVPSANVLGDIYISNFNFKIIKGSWVDIFAH